MSTTAFGKRAFFASWILLGLVLGVDLVFPGVSDRYRTVPFLVSILLFGLPHGAADLMLLQSHLGTRGTWPLARRFAGYLGIMGGAIALILLMPGVALVGFLLLSAWHFGTSDVHDLKLLGHVEHSGLRSRMRAAARGLLILALPLACAPEASLRVGNDWLRLLGRPGFPDGMHSEVTGLAQALAVAAVVATVVLWIDRMRRGRWEIGLVEAGETGLLVLLLARLDPLYAIGVYFLVCHSLRHVAKLMQFWALEERAGLWALLGRVYLKSVPLLIPTLVVLLLFGVVAAAWNPERGVALLLVTFAAVTLSHHLLVDRVMHLGAVEGK